MILNNLIKIAILDLLKNTHLPVSLYQIITHLRSLNLVDERQGNLALFRLNFLVMNALFQLQQELITEQLYLRISSLAIRLEPLHKTDQTALSIIDNDESLRQYYLDWNNLTNTTEQDVEALLSRFWKRFLSADKRVDALLVLELPVGADWSTIQQSYRRLAAQHHPDKGGCPQRFIEIREAYEILQKSDKSCSTNR
ncbi:DnaJ domain-containing protein [Endozoicomonas sp. SM1973]|uniref:DnaJ domain-containing protein n=1 Tax=Spartinivicinus marinus TaxID=2994442 RepID=A0A853HU65_9GAMM|nr:DNA-J related domain-containing protein [Spartinivicinus marinus]MCX4025461.1 DnaJ domain-containing protein [Spartinivicinus marinus]NYZ65310.1 DnaJ domain-containing protein [Spartinivicinus marinus]